MVINGISSSSDEPKLATAAPGGEMGKEAFMQMLITQMRNQDPMNPMDNSAMIAQLAQFSSLEQMQRLNGQFEAFQQSTTSALSMMTAGKPVVLELTDGSEVSGVLEKVQWNAGETQFVINGTAYSAGAVRSLRAETVAPEGAANELGVKND